MKHQHKQIQADTDCCNTSHRNPTNVKHNEHPHNHEDDDGHNHDHDASDKSKLQLFLPAIVSFSLLVVGLVLDHLIHPTWFQGWVRLALYLAAYLPVGIPVLKDALYSISKGDIFSEFFLMGIATLGAFAIKEYPEGVAVMLFYAVGEVFQTLAVTKAKGNIKALLDQRPDEVTVLVNGMPQLAKAKTVAVGSIIQLKPGEKLALDGELISESAAFNTAALTGESKPDTKKKGNLVLAGMINLNTPSQLKVTAAYEDSKLSKILELVQNATTQKSTTELFIRRFAKVYTPIVVFLALSICLLPYFFVANYVFVDWLYKALIFLVISCPCALVISIPLGYFGGIGAASRNGILFKGGNFIDILANIKQVVMDKTGTLTAGVFKVQQATILDGFDRTELLKWVNALESNSTHPVATAIRNFVGEVDHSVTLHEVEEIAGHGLKASINGKPFLVGNFRLMDKFNISYNKALSDVIYTVIAIAYDGKFAGYLTIADNIKPDAPRAIKLLQQLGINVTMLSGDKTSVVNDVAKQLGIKQAFGDLLPEDKVEKVKELKNRGLGVAFVGDGVNDAPVVALSDVGIAMGGLGSDATVEAADVVVQDDMPSRIPVAIQISKQTKRIVWQNIALAFGVKAIVLILGAGGLATMWEAVFADVGVALAAILNAVRIQRMEF
ncbi:heavy metal translocating P-type ATPase [Nubsella zeaxanthinifaciens]|jgi:Cd2+/Zn2+-exporting ATPase|uniref:heavy metal translocating P-type ATPase n=1 Tax=Nubsella zeaxanthinifaciens TaxID=392412 RepID=UPI000DE57067|nr:heavy metal translocating P-type ATPase [Nubsella zeaxanthinifaciens]